MFLCYWGIAEARIDREKPQSKWKLIFVVNEFVEELNWRPIFSLNLSKYWKNWALFTFLLLLRHPDASIQSSASSQKNWKTVLILNNLDFSISVDSDLRNGLKGADFVVISIEVGDRFALWDMDWRIPQQYGIGQVYGENGGPGGLFHSLRIIPPILEICQKVVDVAPNATVFNYSNPMSRICTTVHRAFPELKFIGMCH